ncbi:hypothetical protein [Chryseobacterium indoltheticum]|uniref:hypothetical protein n=1 Tax=Chryseobacterium indoltheticum TaxID=254 RepID=UPI003F498F8D
MFVYHRNGNIMERGQSKLDISENERHWYYFGEWKFYDENGKLKYIKKYADGKKIDILSFNEQERALARFHYKIMSSLALAKIYFQQL